MTIDSGSLGVVFLAVGAIMLAVSIGLAMLPRRTWSERCPHNQKRGTHCIGCHRARACLHYRK